jgi:hypothetical protein
MGMPKEPEPVKLFLAITFRREEHLLRCLPEVEAEFGPIDIRGKAFVFDHTRYYEREMGSPLAKQFVAFERLVSPGWLADAKLATNRIEDRFRVDGRRTVNLDPGYVDAARIVLATTKDFGHRVYLRNGIYADVHLRFQGGDVQYNPWTYPDYKIAEVRDFFLQVRAMWLKQRRSR